MPSISDRHTSKEAIRIIDDLLEGSRSFKYIWRYHRPAANDERAAADAIDMYAIRYAHKATEALQQKLNHARAGAKSDLAELMELQTKVHRLLASRKLMTRAQLAISDMVEQLRNGDRFVDGHRVTGFDATVSEADALDWDKIAVDLQKFLKDTGDASE